MKNTLRQTVLYNLFIEIVINYNHVFTVIDIMTIFNNLYSSVFLQGVLYDVLYFISFLTIQLWYNYLQNVEVSPIIF